MKRGAGIALGSDVTVQKWAWLAALAGAVGCVDMEPVPPRDAGVPAVPEDAGVDAGKPDAGPRDAGLPTPDDTLVSIGVTDNSGGAPQAAPNLQLKFHGGIAGPGVIAARRIGIRELVLPEANRKDFDELPEYLRAGFEVHFARRYDDVFRAVFRAEPAAP